MCTEGSLAEVSPGFDSMYAVKINDQHITAEQATAFARMLNLPCHWRIQVALRTPASASISFIFMHFSAKFLPQNRLSLQSRGVGILPSGKILDPPLLRSTFVNTLVCYNSMKMSTNQIRLIYTRRLQSNLVKHICLIIAGSFRVSLFIQRRIQTIWRRFRQFYDN